MWSILANCKCNISKSYDAGDWEIDKTENGCGPPGWPSHNSSDLINEQFSSSKTSACSRKEYI